MRKMFLFLLLIVCLLLPASALAAGFTFAEQGAAVQIDTDDYTVITAENVEGKTQWLTSHGTTAAMVIDDFNSRGVLLQAWNKAGDVCIEISAVQDSYAVQYHDVNQVTDTERKNYRIGHASDKTGEWRALGYDYDSDAAWKNYKNIGRFLQLEYTRTVNGETYRGYARKTIRNGWHFHIDYQVFGRSLKKTADTKALEAVIGTWKFMEVTSRPATSATRVIFTATPPQETNTGKFTLEGTGSTGLKLIAVAMRMSNREVRQYEATIDSKGSFQTTVQLPSEGYWQMTYTVLNGETVVEEGHFDPITYDDTLLPVSMNSELPATMTLTGNSFTISGKTLKQTKVQCIVDGRDYNKNITTNNSGAFSFTIDTSAEGVYNITLVFQKKGYDDRRFRCEARREFTVEDSKQAIRDAAIKPAYDTLKKKLQDYRGRYFVYSLYIKEVTETPTGYLTFAGMSKTKSGVYKEQVVIRTTEAPGWRVGAQIRMYLKCLGTYDVISDDGTSSYPYFDLQWVE